MKTHRGLTAGRARALRRWRCRRAAPDDSSSSTIGQRGNWDTADRRISATKAGIFKKHGLTLELTYTSGSGETMQPVISGSVDLGLAVGTLGAMAAFAKGAPVRIIGAGHRRSPTIGTPRRTSPLKTLKDANGQDHRLLDQWLLHQLRSCSPSSRSTARRQADRDRQSVGHADRGDDATRSMSAGPRRRSASRKSRKARSSCSTRAARPRPSAGRRSAPSSRTSTR